MKHKTINFTVKQLGDIEQRVLRFIGSTESVDRDGDIISADGWELDNYKKNPVFLWAHDYKIPPIGRAIDVRVVNKQLIFDIEFPDEGIFPLADTIFKLYKGNFLNATSVGFIGKEGEPTKTGYAFTRQELIELSAVPVPSNPTALQQAKSLGFIKQGVTKFFDEDYIEIVEDNEIEFDITPDELISTVNSAVSTAIKGGRR